ncbi:ABC transporter permease [Actinomyces sp. B33]|uniref:ABC transporter permease n=1 Tax=Actinomyces sp. B33 TaxID=2942131 RepID=UPI00233FDC99|nr:ABC transporter permease [Actinomyces sp. B33]MDC4233419.1 ABC transporter permease [Actinomyces sp. B33]
MSTLEKTARSAGSDLMRRIWAARDTKMAMILITAIVLALIFVPRFGQPRTLTYLTLDITTTLLMALPMTLVMVNADIDLSVASTAGLVSAVMGVMIQHGIGFWATLLVCLFVGLLCGAFNGVLTAFVGIPALAVTIGTLALYRGLALVIIGDQSISAFPEWATSFATGSFGSTGIPYVVVPLAVFVLAFWVLLHKTPYGRGLYALGHSQEAARFVGIDTRKSRMCALVLSGVMAAVAGVFYTLRYSAAKSDNVEGLELTVIAAIVFGGVSVFGGKGSIWGSLFGVLIVGVLNYALRLNRIPEVVLVMITGLLLIGSVVAPSVAAAWKEWRSGRHPNPVEPASAPTPGAVGA